MSTVLNIDALILRCVNQDSVAWAQFINCFTPTIYAAIKSKIKMLRLFMPQSDVCDIYQDVILSIWKQESLKSLRNARCISSWLTKIAHNKVLDFIKRKNYSRHTSSNFLLKTHLTRNSYDVIFGNALRHQIDFFIENLPLLEKRISILRFSFALKYNQISKIVNTPQGTVSGAIRKIKIALRKHLLEAAGSLDFCADLM